MRYVITRVKLLGMAVIGYGLYSLFSGVWGMVSGSSAVPGAGDTAFFWSFVRVVLLALPPGMALLAGAGLYLRRPWGLTLGTLLSVNILVNLVLRAWFYGPQRYGVWYFVLWGAAVSGALVLLWQPKAWALLKANGKRFPFLLRTLAVLFGVTIAGKLVVMATSCVVIAAVLEDSSGGSAGTVRYEKPRWNVALSERRLFGYRMRLPKTMVLNSLRYEGGDSRVWTVELSQATSNASGKGDIDLTVRSRGGLDVRGDGLAHGLGFRSVFDMEQAICRRPRTPAMVFLRQYIAACPPGFEQESVQEVTAYGWHGFMWRFRDPDDGTRVYSCHAYDEENGRSADIVLSFRRGALKEREARDILASFRFDEGAWPAGRYFAEGREAERRGALRTALEGYGNAMYRDPDDPGYAYRAGKVFLLLGDTARAGEFFRRAVALAPGHAPAKRALRSLPAGPETGGTGNVSM